VPTVRDQTDQRTDGRHDAASANDPAEPPAAPSPPAASLSGRVRSGASVRQAAVTLSDLTADMPWLILARAVPMSLRPKRLARAIVTIAALVVIWAMLRTITGPVVAEAAEQYRAALGSAARDLAGGAWAQSGTWLDALAVQIPADLWRAHRGNLVLHALLALGVLGVSGLAAARSAALEAGLRSVSKPGWAPAPTEHERPLLFSLRHAPAVLGAMGLLIALPVATLLITALLGLIPRPGGVLGAFLFGLLVLGGLATALLALIALLAGPFVAPAIACDGDDGLDAAQRAPAYALARPGTLVTLGVLAIAQGFVLLGVLLGLRSVGLDLAAWAAGPDVLRDAGAGLDPAGELRTWGVLTGVLVVAILLSYAQVACTLIHLLLRRACDGQPLTEIWRAGDTAGVLTLDRAR